MSTELQFDLFTIETPTFNSDVSNNGIKSVKTIATVKTTSPKIIQVREPFVGPFENYRHLEHLSDVHAAAKLNFLKENLVVGDLLQIEPSYTGRRFIIFKSLEGTSFTGELYQPDFVDPNKDKKGKGKAKRKTNMTIDLSEIMLVESTKLGVLYFNENPLNGLKVYVNPATHITDYINNLSDVEKQQLIISQLYFDNRDGNNYTYDKVSDITREFEKYIKLLNEPSYYSPRKLGMAGFCFSAKRSYHKYKINFFGEESEETISDLNSGYKVFVETIKKDFKQSGALSYNDSQLIAYYHFKGYILNFDMITSEWSLKHNFSDKLMHLEREEALYPEVLLSKYTAYCYGGNSLLAKNFTREDTSDCITKYLTTNVPLVPYKLPVNAIVKTPKDIFKLTKIEEYLIVSDNGKQVELKPLGPIYGDSITKPVVVPRSKISAIKFPHEPANKRKVYGEVYVPFGATDSLCNEETYYARNSKFLRQLSNRELKQLVTFKAILERGIFLSQSRILRAIFENDLDSVYKSIDEGFKNVSGSGGILREALNASFGNSGTRFTFSSYDGDIDIELELNDVVEVISEMFSAIQSLERSQLTLFELKLLYSFSGNELNYTGLDTHFVFNKQSIHSTRRDILTLA